MKAQVIVTVNGQPVEQYVSQQRSREISDFFYSEIRGMRRVSARHISSAPSTKNQSKVEQLGNGSIRCA